MNAPADWAERIANLEREVGDLQQRVVLLERSGIRVDGPDSTPTTAPTPPSRFPASAVVARAPHVTPPTPTPTPNPDPAPPPLPPELARSAPPSRPVHPAGVIGPAAIPDPAAPSALHELFAALKLLPPDRHSGGEAQLGAWWSTRIGALLAVIGVVFFGIYLSAHTAPAVRWIELVVITTVVAVAGARFERRALRIGPVISGAGLALIYFTAFAAHAITAVRVIHSPALALVAQLAAVGWVGATALRRESATTATMAVLLGFVSVCFSWSAGFDHVAGLAALGLAGAAVAYQARKGWLTPVFCSAVLTPLVLLMLVATVWRRTEVAGAATVAYAFILTGFGLHLLVPLRAVLRTTADRLPPAYRALQALSTALSLLAGFFATEVLAGHAALAAYCFATGTILAGLAYAVGQRLPADGLFAQFAVKAASLFTLGIIIQWDARTRWLALLLQATTLLASAHRTRRRSLLVTALAVWVVSVGYYRAELPALVPGLASPVGLAVVSYLWASVALLAWAGRRTWFASLNDRDWQIGLGLAAAVPVILTSWQVQAAPWAPLAGLGGAIGCAWIGQRLHTRTGWPAAAGALLGAHLALQCSDLGQTSFAWRWGGAVPLAAATLALSWRLGSLDPAAEGRRGCGLVAGLLGQAALAAAWLQTVATTPALTAVIAGAVGWAAVGRRRGRTDVMATGMLALATGLALTVTRYDFSLAAGPSWWLVPAALGVPALWLLGGAHREPEVPELQVGQGVVAVAGVPVLWAALHENLPALGLAWVGLAVIAGLTMLSTRLRQGGPAAAATALAGLLGGWLATHPAWSSGAWSGLTLPGAMSVAVVLAWLPLWAARTGVPRLADGLVQTWRVVAAILAAVLLTEFALRHGTPWQALGSAVWAVGGIALFIVGLSGRARSHRITGLSVLALCIPRVFWHDIHDAQHRIIAFIVLGLLLIWVGFSYQRFRHLIDGTDRPPDPS